jgi:hypothetical protein
MSIHAVLGEFEGQPASGTIKVEEISESSLDDFEV